MPPAHTLQTLHSHLTHQVFRVWWQHEMRGTGDSVPHLAAALAVLVHDEVERGNSPLLERFCRRASSRFPLRRRAAMRVLVTLSPRVEEEGFLSLLCSRLTDRDEQVRLLALTALERSPWLAQETLKQAACPLFRSLTRLVETDTMPIRLAAARLLLRLNAYSPQQEFTEALRRLETAGGRAQYALEGARQGRSDAPAAPETKCTPAHAAVWQNTLSRASVLHLVSELSDAVPSARARAARRLGEMMREGVRIYRQGRHLVVFLPYDKRTAKPAALRKEGQP